MCLWAFFPPLTLWASAMAVWLLRVWCSRGVPDIDVKLPTEWFHISASCVIEQGAREISNTVKRRSHYDSQSKVVLFGAVWHASFMHPVWYASALSPQYAGWYLWGRAVFPTIKQHMKQCAFSSLSHTHANTHSFFMLPADETIAASCHGERCWCRGFSKGIWKQFYWWRLW